VLVQRVVAGDARAGADELAAATGRETGDFLDSPFVILGDGAAGREHVDRLAELGVTYVVAFAERGADDLAATIAAVR
jgi:phage terminase large subunit-like protein